MRVTKQMSMPRALHEAFEKLPINRSAATSQAVLNAFDDPELLVKALRARLHRPAEENDVRTSISFDPRVGKALDDLSGMTKLPNEQVLRLVMEAYINKL